MNDSMRKGTNRVAAMLAENRKETRLPKILWPLVALFCVLMIFEGSRTLEVGGGIVRTSVYSWWGCKLDATRQIPVSEVGSVDLRHHFGGGRHGGKTVWFVSITSADGREWLREPGSDNKEAAIRRQKRIILAMKPDGDPYKNKWHTTLMPWLFIAFGAVAFSLIAWIRIDKIGQGRARGE
jgi:hypothetical protein